MSSFGRLFRVSTFGESHCKGVGCIVEGIHVRVYTISALRSHLTLLYERNERFVVFDLRGSPTYASRGKRCSDTAVSSSAGAKPSHHETRRSGHRHYHVWHRGSVHTTYTHTCIHYIHAHIHQHTYMHTYTHTHIPCIHFPFRAYVPLSRHPPSVFPLVDYCSTTVYIVVVLRFAPHCSWMGTVGGGLLCHCMSMCWLCYGMSMCWYGCVMVCLCVGPQNGFTLGTPIALFVANQDQRPHDYSSMTDIPRPSHADYTYQVPVVRFVPFVVCYYVRICKVFFMNVGLYCMRVCLH